MEAKLLMLATNNIIAPSSGKPIAVPSQDMVMGCYYMTKERKGGKGEGSILVKPINNCFYQAKQQEHTRLYKKFRIDEEIVETTP